MRWRVGREGAKRERAGGTCARRGSNSGLRCEHFVGVVVGEVDRRVVYPAEGVRTGSLLRSSMGGEKRGEGGCGRCAIGGDIRKGDMN